MKLNKLDYAHLTKNISQIIKKNPFVSVFSCGKSEEGRDILCLKFGKGDKKIFLNGAHHSLEWITSSLLLSYVNDFSNYLKKEEDFLGYNILDLYKKTSFYVVPMVNPDGVELVINGIDKLNEKYDLVKKALGKNKLNKVWQANINGVDLNHNYDTSFYEGKEYMKNLGIGVPSSSKYSGAFPFSESETRAIKQLCEKEKFDLTVAFHSQGEAIYWNYNEKGFLDKAKKLAKVSGYTLITPNGTDSYSGFKDWMIEKFNVPSFTVEVGKGENPVKFSGFDKIKKDNYKLINECCYI